MDQRPKSRVLSRLSARNSRADGASDDDAQPSAAAATLRSIKRKHMNSRSVSPAPVEQDVLPGLASTSWFASSDEPSSSPEAIRNRPVHQHKQSVGHADPLGKSTQAAPQKLRRRERKHSDTEAIQQTRPDEPSHSPIGHPSVASPDTATRTPAKAPAQESPVAPHENSTLPKDAVHSWSPDARATAARDMNASDQRRRLLKQRPTSSHAPADHPVPSVNEPSPQSSPADQEAGPAPPVDPRKILLLMRKTSGRMQGQLLHKSRGSKFWIRSHCFIDADSGSLVSEDDVLGQPMVLLKSLHQCRVQAHLHTDSNTFILQLSSKDMSHSLQLSPPDQLLFNAWFAALLCWKPVQQSQRPHDKDSNHRPILIRQISDYLPKVDPGILANPIRKVGNAVLVEPDHSRAGHQSSTSGRYALRTRWRTVSCTLNARGELRVHSKNLNVLVSVLLSELPRSSIQRLSASVLGADCVIAIYPQYCQNTNACSRIRPIYLSYESRELFEVWFVLMRAHAIPELYGASRMQAAADRNSSTGFLPGLKQETSPPLFRISNTLHVRLNEAKLRPVARDGTPEPFEDSPRAARQKRLPPASFFVEILLDGQVKARSTFRFDGMEPVWYEGFEFSDLPNSLSTISVRVKKQNAGRGGRPEESPADDTNDKPDIVCGEAFVERSALDAGKDDENWHEIVDTNGNVTGEISLKVRLDERTVLMDQEYDQISDLLHNFSNCLTLQIYERIPSKLNQLAETLLNIFQVSGQAGDWLMFLAEEEIDGVRETAPGRVRFTQRLESTESRESLNTGEREGLVRDLGRTATAEANLLFRGNTLLSKALDMHMRRLGRDYLELTLGDQLRFITVQDLDCEVDPTKIGSPQNMQKNWARLMSLAERTWDVIAGSASACPTELRIIFRHIRACADDRYGDYLRSVPYSSVSGFLFLRFFCAAVLNPQLFGLIDSAPRPRAQRTYILLAKSLQGLANMTTFGHKEPWMSPMNAFLNSRRQAFKNFIDEICNVSSDEHLPVPASYNIPYIIFQKSPLPSREGFPSLPYLIDRAQNLAGLVDLWLEGVSSAASDGLAPPGTSNQLTGDLARFHDFCLGLHQRTRAAYRSADRSGAATPSPLNHRWVAIAQHMEVAPEEFWVKQRGERQRTEEARARAASPLGRKISAARAWGPQHRSGSRGGREETWKPLTIRRRAGSQPVASAAALSGDELARHETSGSEGGEGEDMVTAEERPGTPQMEERENHWRHFWRKRGRTPDKRESTA